MHAHRLFSLPPGRTFVVWGEMNLVNFGEGLPFELICHRRCFYPNSKMRNCSCSLHGGSPTNVCTSFRGILTVRLLRCCLSLFSICRRGLSCKTHINPLPGTMFYVRINHICTSSTLAFNPLLVLHRLLVFQFSATSPGYTVIALSLYGSSRPS